MSEIKQTKVYNISDFINWYDKGELQLSPKYQRNPVWDEKANSYLIDTIVRGLPIPQIFLRQIIDTNTKTTLREVIDGQQRLRAILRFVKDDFKIMKIHNNDFANLTYSTMSEEAQEAFLNYDIPVEIIKLKEDSKVYSMFARLNTNSMTLNKQELRNAKYWGDFKVFIYKKILEWRTLFLKIQTFKDKDVSRMLDVEFLSTLVIFLIDKYISESPAKVDEYYKKFDNDFDCVYEIEKKLDFMLEIMCRIFNDNIYKPRYFHRKNYFYTLFACVYEFFNIESQINFSLDDNKDLVEKCIDKLSDFESHYERSQGDGYPDNDFYRNLITFEKNHRTRTTSKEERQQRVNILLDYLRS